MKMKKLLTCLAAVLLVGMMIVALVACDSGSDPAPADHTQTPAGEENVPKVQKTKYAVKFYDEDGNLLTTEQTEEGTVPSYDYVKADTAEYDYTVEGWATAKGGAKLDAIPAATANAEYFAVVSKVKRSYTVTFASNGGSTVTALTKEYGTEISAPAKPTRSGYSFVGWCTDSTLNNKVTFPYTVTGNVILYASWNETIDIKSYLSTLVASRSIGPDSYLPDTMKAGYAGNVIASASAVSYNYADGVALNSINYNGFGEQWNMIVENVNQSKTFYNVLNLAESGITAGVTAFNNWFDSNPGASADYETKVGNYDVYITFHDGVLVYTLVFDTNVPLLGSLTAQVDMTLTVATGCKTVRIQLNDSNALKYEVNEDSYKFAIKYGVGDNGRRAYFEVTRNDDDTVEGAIYEHIEAKGKDLISSNAQFFIDEDYVTAVGNKAGGMLGFKGYVNELYDVETGRLLGYEVRETLTKIQYNTLWFKLSDIGGITQIKAVENDNFGEYGDNNHDIYLNGADSVFTIKKVGGLSTKTLSRRYDIEMRSMFFYYYDSAKGEYVKVEASVPMLFVQAEQYDTLEEDIEAQNDDLNVTISVNGTAKAKIEDDYATLIDLFIEDVTSFDSDAIETYIGDARDIDGEE